MPIIASHKPATPSPDADKTLPLIKHISLSSLHQPDPQKSSALGTLPLDIWNSILDHLTPLDLVSLAQLNSTFHTTVTTSLPWRFYTTLFPTSRRIWALSWKEAHDGYFARTAPPRGDEVVNFSTANGTLPQDKAFASLFLGTNRRVIEFFGASVRHRHDTFLTQTDDVTHTCRSWQITSTEQYSMGQVMSVKKRVVKLPPIGNHLKPAGLDVVGTFLFWVDYADSALEYTIDADGISFTEEFGEMVLWPDRAFDEDTEGPSLLRRLFLSWGESQFDFTGQMVCARASVGGRKQVLRLYDYESLRVHNIPFEYILGDSGPWLGPWKAPWILPWGFDDDGNLLFKILDTRRVDSTEYIRCVQTSFNLDTMRTTFSVEILEDIQLLNPWNFQMFSDQCWGYPARDVQGDIWCILRDLRDGNLVRRIGPLNVPGSRPKDYSCHISMFHIIFQDKSARFRSTPASTPAPTPLRIFPINDLPPSIQRKYRLPTCPPASQAHMLYELSPPAHPSPPGFWTFGGEDAAERYLFFQGSTRNTENAALYDDWKKWVVWDSVRREWSVLQCRHEWLMDGFYCLFSETDGEEERVGLDWVRMELRE